MSILSHYVCVCVCINKYIYMYIYVCVCVHVGSRQQPGRWVGVRWAWKKWGVWGRIVQLGSLNC